MSLLLSPLTAILALLSRLTLRRYRPVVVAVTGSVGKTSTKEAIATALAGVFRLRSAARNYNNEIGVPLAIIGADRSPGRSLLGWLRVIGQALAQLLRRDASYPQLLVLEYGADHPGDIAKLVRLARPDVAVVTAIGEAHLANFPTLAALAKEKGELVRNLTHDSWAILNADDAAVANLPTKAKRLTYGVSAGAQVRAVDSQVQFDQEALLSERVVGLQFKVQLQGSLVPVRLPGVLSEAQLSAALAALAVAQALRVNVLEATQRLQGYQPSAGRLRPIPGVRDTLLIDDTYNSSPLAARHALISAAQVPLAPGSRRWAVLGDMLELGPEEVAFHRELGQTLANLPYDRLVTVGKLADQIGAGAIAAGLLADLHSHFPDAAAAGRALQEQIRPGDILLVKGSQGMRCERIIKELMAEPARAAELLVRQDARWQEM